MKDKDIFDEAVADHGGRLDTTSLHPADAQALEYIAGRARDFLQTAAASLTALPPIHFDFINNWQFNARAFRCNERYFIGVNKGAVFTLSVLFDRMLADPNVLPFVGDAAEEVTDLPLFPDIGADFERLAASVPVFPRPRNRVRQSHARRLGELALDFLTAHEFAHIANGHVDYMEESQGISAVDERSGASLVSGIRESMVASQTMEMDADATAVWISLSSEWGKIAGIFPRPSPPWADFYNYPGMVSLLWSYAVSSLFRIFGEARLTDEDITLEPYPRPRLRSVMIQQAAGRNPRPQGLSSVPPLVGDEVYNIPLTIKGAHRDVESIFSQLTGNPEAMEGLDDAWGDIGKTQMGRLQEYWRTELKGKLLRFAHHPLSTYGEEATEEGS